MNQNFVVAATFLDDDGDVVVLTIPFSDKVRKEISELLLSQFNALNALDDVPYSVRYQASEDERLVINNYSDPDKTLQRFIEICHGSVYEDLDKAESLAKCKALLFCVPTVPGKVLIQRFSRATMASRDKYFGFFSGNTVSKVEKDSFTLGSSLAGFFDVQDCSLTFRNVNTIRGALPKFEDEYAPWADDATMDKFFSDVNFDKRSALDVIKKKSKKVQRLVWLLDNQKVNVKAKLSEFHKIDRLLNMNSFQDGKIYFPGEVNKITIILRTLLGDVTEEDGVVYLSNSKRPIEPFQ